MASTFGVAGFYASGSDSENSRGATFKDVCDYMSASFNAKRVKILFWKYSLIFELMTPCDKVFDL